MPLLKQQPAAPPAAVVLDLTDLGRQAQRLREQARLEADALLEAAKAEAAGLGAAAEEAARAAGHAEGRAAGFSEGEAAGREEARAAEAARLGAVGVLWSEAASAVAQTREAIAAEAESAVLRLAVALAEKVLARRLEVDPEAAVDATRDALSHVLDPIASTVRVHPEDLAAVGAALPGLTPAGGGPVRVVADAAVGPGGCVVEHGAGEVDATVQTKLDRVASLLLGEPRDGLAAEEAE